MSQLVFLKSFPGKIKNLFTDNFELKSTKRSFITGVVFWAVLTLASIIDIGEFIGLNLWYKWYLIAAAFILPVCVGFCICKNFSLKNEKNDFKFHLANLFLMPLLTIAMAECLNGVFIFKMEFKGFVLNYILILLLYLFAFALCGSLRISTLIVNSLIFGFAVTNSYILSFRGSPFLPMDLTGAKTGMNVATSYHFRLLYNVLLGTYLFIIIVTIAIKTKTPTLQKRKKIIVRSLLGALFILFLYLFYFTPAITNVIKIKDNDFQWNAAKAYKRNGFTFSFFFNTKYLLVETPDGYNHSEVVSIVEASTDDTAVKNEDITPNIICIMNESLSDLSVLGEFSTNEDYMPFMRSLKENTVRGNLYVPVVGGGTSNSEFEFLTGNSVAFLPSGSNAYMLYVNGVMNSLVSTLEAQGYSSLAMHPYYASGWNRTAVYNYFGFNDFVSIEDMIDPSVLEVYDNKGDPDYFQDLLDEFYKENSNMLVRQHISDAYNYKLIIDDFEKRDKSVPYFIFDVTMQNHSEYYSAGRNFNECISITSSHTYYTQASKYLSLVKASDDAFKDLIEYFKGVDEPTIICMFGDHQPNIEPEFLASVMGVDSIDSLTVEQSQQRHMTPFIIWANYDIKEQNIERLSSNYLSSLLLKIAGLDMPDYNKYLLRLSETLPVIDTVGYMDNDGNCYKFTDESDYNDLISAYKIIQYNNLFDTDNKQNDMFYINGFRIEDAKPEESDSGGDSP